MARRWRSTPSGDSATQGRHLHDRQRSPRRRTVLRTPRPAMPTADIAPRRRWVRKHLPACRTGRDPVSSAPRSRWRWLRSITIPVESSVFPSSLNSFPVADAASGRASSAATIRSINSGLKIASGFRMSTYSAGYDRMRSLCALANPVFV